PPPPPLCSPSFPTRRSSDLAAFALGRLGPKAAPAVPQLVERATRDDQADVRRTAVESVGRLAADARGAVPGLAQALKDRDADVRDRKSTRLNSSHSQISYAV